MRACTACGEEVRDAYRFCPWCGTVQRRKVVQFFWGTAAVPEDERRALRVSRYVHEGHVRFSVWDEFGAAEAAVSLDEAEAARLVAFLGAHARRPSLVDDLRARVLGRQ